MKSALSALWEARLAGWGGTRSVICARSAAREAVSLAAILCAKCRKRLWRRVILPTCAKGLNSRRPLAQTSLSRAGASFTPDGPRKSRRVRYPTAISGTNLRAKYSHLICGLALRSHKFAPDGTLALRVNARVERGREQWGVPFCLSIPASAIFSVIRPSALQNDRCRGL